MAGLKAFVKGSSDPKDNMPGCANYDHHYGGCLFSDTCKVEKGLRCSYFEKAVLPTAGQLKTGHRITDDYQKISGGLMIKTTKTRFCECGNSIPSNKQFCDTCRKKKRKKSYREYMQHYRLNQRNTEVEKQPL
ncbi:MAG: cysteine-rich VLP domain-containing protein [Dehalococcoidia bacterium]|nr:cysteine-rich VLP domain-containing protein [Dehalococcoidia bacterium]